MEFVARLVGERYECRLLSAAEEIVWHLRVPDNTVEYWHLGLEKWIIQRPEKFSMLVSSIDELCALWDELFVNHREGSISLDVPLTFLKLIAALGCTLSSRNMDDALRNAFSKTQTILLTNKKLNLQLMFVEMKYTYGIIVDGDNVLPLSFTDHDLDQEKGIPVDWWNLWFLHNYERHIASEADGVDKKNNSEVILKILTNLDLLDELVYRQSDGVMISEKATFRINSWTNFLKAAINFLEDTQDSVFLPFRKRRLSNLYALVVQDEQVDLEEQKMYLERIFSQRELHPADKYELLLGIVLPDLREDAIRNIHHQPRLVAAISAISQYYLRRYDLDNAIQPWVFLSGLDQNILLQVLLAFYRRPYLYAASGVLGGMISLLPSFWPSQTWLITVAWSISSLLFFITLGLAITGMSIIFSRFFSKRGLDYIDLFLPRLFGAIIVGLSILVFENTIWDATLKLQWINWLLICASVYGGSLIYFFFDIHKSTRLQTIPIKETSQYRSSREQSNLSISYSIRMAWKIFWIGLSESFAATLLVTVVFAHAIIFDNFTNIYEFPWRYMPDLSAWLIMQKDMLGYAWQVGQLGLFIYIPKVVILWTGLALLIGAFVQLLWQEQRMTSS